MKFKLIGLCTVFALIFGNVEAGKSRKNSLNNVATQEVSTSNSEIQRLNAEIQELSQRAQEIAREMQNSPKQVVDLAEELQ